MNRLIFLLFFAACATHSSREPAKHVRLPFQAKTKFLVSQGAFGKASHSEEGNEYSWDFDVPFGTKVVAVEAGTVLDVWEPGQGGGCDPRFSRFAHNIKIEHADGTVAQYVHIQSKVKPGMKVATGEVIAITSENGWICQPQLHFGIYASKDHLYPSPNRKTLPLYFEGLPDGEAREGYEGVVGE